MLCALFFSCHKYSPRINILTYDIWRNGAYSNRVCHKYSEPYLSEEYYHIGIYILSHITINILQNRHIGENELLTYRNTSSKL